MSGIYLYRGLYKGETTPKAFSSVKAMLSFSSTPSELGIANTRCFAPEEARKGFEMLKRWISTGAFKTVLLECFISSLEIGNTSHIVEWLRDHSSESDFPNIILIGDTEKGKLGAICKEVGEDELEKLLNT